MWGIKAFWQRGIIFFPYLKLELIINFTLVTHVVIAITSFLTNVGKERFQLTMDTVKTPNNTKKSCGTSKFIRGVWKYGIVSMRNSRGLDWIYNTSTTQSRKCSRHWWTKKRIERGFVTLWILLVMFCAALIAGLNQLLSTTLEIQFTWEFQVLVTLSYIILMSIIWKVY